MTGAQLSEVEVAFPPNSLLLELADGWYLWPPLPEAADMLDAACDIAMHRQRTSSVRPLRYARADWFLWDMFQT